jgi:hypothetical protein
MLEVRFRTYASNDLMNMRRRIGARIDQRIEPLDSELRASKAQKTCLSRSKEPEGSYESVDLHSRLCERCIRGPTPATCTAIISNSLCDIPTTAASRILAHPHSFSKMQA